MTDEENFAEAVKAVNHSLVETSVPTRVRDILNAPETRNLDRDSPCFRIICSGIGDFVSKHGCLPLRGTLPDMISDSETYVRLLEIYRAKAIRDADEVRAIVRAKCEALGRDSNEFTDELVRYFCRNAAFLRAFQGSSLADEYKEGAARKTYEEALNGSDANNMLLYVLIRACDRFFVEMDRYPGLFLSSLFIHSSKDCNF